MKEIWLFTTAGSVDETIMRLGELGVVDIEEINGSHNGTAERRAAAVRRSGEAIEILKAHVPKGHSGAPERQFLTRDPEQLVGRVLQTEELCQKCRERLQALRVQLNWYDTWGRETRVKDLAYLRQMGIYLRLYLADKSELAALQQQHTIISLPERDGKVPVVLVSRQASEKLNRKEVPLPEWPYADVKQQADRKERQLKAIDRFLQSRAAYLDELKDYQLFLKDRLDIQEALEQTGDIEGRLKYLKGYIPQDAADAFVAVAEANHWGYRIAEPENPENVPVYIRNPKWIRIINPVMKFIDIVPGYREVDVSIYFLIAFALFFAMLVGDAGYGLVFLLIAFFL